MLRQKTKELKAYGRNFNDLPANPSDDFSFRVKGDFGIETLFRKYEANNNDRPDNVVDDIKWPTTEEEMLGLQRQDPCWRPFIERLDKMWDDQLAPNERVIRTVKDISGNHTIILLEQQDRSREALRIFDSRSKCHHGREILPTSLHRQALLMYHNQHQHCIPQPH